MLADGKFVDAYWRQVANSKKQGGNYVFPCSSKLPDMEVSIVSAGAVTIPGSRFKGAGVGSGESIFLLSRREVVVGMYGEVDCSREDRYMSRITPGSNIWIWQRKYRRPVFHVDVCRL